MSNFTVRPCTISEIRGWIRDLFDTQNCAFGVWIVGFTGDRLMAVHDGAGFFALNAAGHVVGAITYSPTGEVGAPSIIGLYARGDCLEIGAALARAALDALSPARVRFDAVSPFESSVFTQDVLGEDYIARADVRRY